MRVAVLGFGREGQSVLEFLKKSPKYDFADIWILDQNSKLKIPAELKKRPFRPVELKTGKNYLRGLEKFNLIFRSPGIPYNLPEIQKAIKQGTIFSSATKLFFENCSCCVIGVTGAKGKSTTSALIYQILKNSGFEVYLAGNIGQSPLNIISHLTKNSIVILELSSFQLQDLTISPQIAVVLEIFPDHLDAHKDFKEYLEAKTNIVRYQIRENKIFFFRDNKYAVQISKKTPAKKFRLPPRGFQLFKSEDLKIPGQHNFLNAVTAALVARALDCPDEKIIETVKNFAGLEHRLEFVEIIKPETPYPVPYASYPGFYNDSASTNPQTTIAAFNTFQNPIILIAGGHDKGLNYKPWSKIFRSRPYKKPKLKYLILFGENKEKIKFAFRHHSQILKNLRMVKNLKEAVSMAKNLAVSGDIVLFSPGAASFDMFKDYADRGKKFKEIVSRLNNANTQNKRRFPL